ncbi:hypothetical protein N6H18_17915 [Reichenbachiella agarivorans]|uniref:Uncharacterized protein n=1 Tax=Reichenbachiella agarivorans TaxID=2979464 RepID=A0ABY6CQW4_9BACT|nr:hypothetical protein [Reichenbachiella agarivorans]UXP32219.1 hypothetical protein N6H18_17915 [Reichenbachiella agarivorans]
MSKFTKSILILLCCTVFQQVQAQKYKDIFALLEAKNYDTAIPMLRSYLSDKKKATEANPNLRMGLYYEELVAGYHLVKDSTAILEAADSSLKYLVIAKTLIDEKELKKNDEFYQMYYRRDLRTGDFGIKLSDVQLDLDNKIKATSNIVSNARQIYKNLYVINSNYTFCKSSYANIVKNHSQEKEFLVHAHKPQMDTLDLMITYMSDVRNAFNKVREAVSLTGVKGYSPELELKQIRSYGKDGLSEVNFYANDVEAWDYGTWAESSFKTIERDVLTLKQELVDFDKKLKAQGESMNGLATVRFETLNTKIDHSLIREMHDLDNNPLPEKLFNIQIGLNLFDFITKPLQNPRIEDEMDIDYQLEITDSLIHILDGIGKNAATLVEPYITVGKKKYASLVEGEYGGDFGLIKLRQKMETFVKTNKEIWEKKHQAVDLKSKWGVSVDGKDSLYLAPREDGVYATRYLSDFYTVATMKDDSSNTYVIGIDFKDKVDHGFIAKVNNARQIVWKEKITLKSFNYDKSDLLVYGAFVPAQSGMVTAYLYSVTEKPHHNMLAVSTDFSGKVKWINHIDAPRQPVQVKLNDIVKETIFYFVAEDKMDTIGPGEVAYKVIDRTGNVR